MSESAKLAIVTGTSAGIGEAAVRDLLANGWTVFGIARRQARIVDSRYTHIAFDLGDVDGLSESIRCTATRANRARRTVDAHRAREQRGDHGPASPARADHSRGTDDCFRSECDGANLADGLHCAHGPNVGIAIRIVNISTGAARGGTAGLSAYAASKAALRVVGITLASESARPPHGQPARDLAILSYEPSTVDTAMQVQARETSVDEFPWVDTFQNFKAEGRLAAASDVTPTIAQFVDSDPAERFSETRYGA